MADSKEQVKYDLLVPLLIAEFELKYYNFPCHDPKHPGRILPAMGVKFKTTTSSWTKTKCIRCLKTYKVDADGMPAEMDWCFYHDKGISEKTNRYSCCDRDGEAEPCKRNTWHINDGKQVRVSLEGFKETQLKRDRESNNHGVFGVCTKHCYTPSGPEVTRVIVVNYNLMTIYDELVKPIKPILDYDTLNSGIKEGDLDKVTTSLPDVQRDLLEMFSSKSILVGHVLHKALKQLKLVHKQVVDTSILYPVRGGPRFRLTLWGCLRHQKQEDTWEKDEVTARLALRVAYKRVSHI